MNKKQEKIIKALTERGMELDKNGPLMTFRGSWPKVNSKIVINQKLKSFIVAVDGQIKATNRTKTEEEWIEELKKIVGCGK